jgi:hypothetical protein
VLRKQQKNQKTLQRKALYGREKRPQEYGAGVAYHYLANDIYRFVTTVY